MLVKYKNNTLDNLFGDDFLTRFFYDDIPSKQVGFIPANDIIEHENEYSVNLMLPGFNKKDFKIELENNKLIVEGERKEESTSKFNVKQSYFGKFKKVYTLPNEVAKEKIDAKYEDGVLKIVVPKDSEKVATKLIEIA